MAALNYAANYATVVENEFYKDLISADIWTQGAQNRFKWIGAKTINIPTSTVKGASDVNRDTITGNKSRSTDNAWEPKQLMHERKWDDVIAPADVDETNLVMAIGQTASTYNREQKIPEMDKYLFSKLFQEKTTYGASEIVTTAIDIDNVLEIFDDLMERMDEGEVPEEGRILYVTPAIEKLLKNSGNIRRDISSAQAEGINRIVKRLDDVKIVKVPSVRFKTLYDFTEGAVPGVGAGQINMLLVHPRAVLAPKKYDVVYLQEPSAVTEGKYYYYEACYYDVFVLAKKQVAVQIAYTAAP